MWNSAELHTWYAAPLLVPTRSFKECRYGPDSEIGHLSNSYISYLAPFIGWDYRIVLIMESHSQFLGISQIPLVS